MRKSLSTLCFVIMFGFPILCLAGEEGEKETPDAKKQEQVKSEKKTEEKPDKKEPDKRKPAKGKTKATEEKTKTPPTPRADKKESDEKKGVKAVKKKAARQSKEKPGDKETASTSTKSAQSDHVEVLDLQMAKSIKEREPVDATDTFESESLTCTWAKLKVKEPETTIMFRYSRNGKVMWTSKPRTVKQSPKWRTWLKSKFAKSGDWKVEVLDAAEKVLSSTNFTVK